MKDPFPGKIISDVDMVEGRTKQNIKFGFAYEYVPVGAHAAYPIDSHKSTTWCERISRLNGIQSNPKADIICNRRHGEIKLDSDGSWKTTGRFLNDPHTGS